MGKTVRRWQMRIKRVKELIEMQLFNTSLRYFDAVMEWRVIRKRIARRAVNDARSVTKASPSWAMHKFGKICAIYAEDLSIENSELCNNGRESSRRGERDVLFASHCSSGSDSEIYGREMRKAQEGRESEVV